MSNIPGLTYNTLTYNGRSFPFCYNPQDPSGEGCIHEIVRRNEYKLENYAGVAGQSIIDIGANCGLATVILALQNPESVIYTFEPDDNLITLINENVRINNLTNVKVFNKAVSASSNDKLNLFIHPEYTGGNTCYTDINTFKAHFKTGTPIIKSVDCISLDDIITQNNITSIHLLKIDCEGAEFEIIYNSALFKTGIIKNIAGEFHDMKYNSLIKPHHTSIQLLKYVKQYIAGICNICILTINEFGVHCRHMD